MNNALTENQIDGAYLERCGHKGEEGYMFVLPPWLKCLKENGTPTAPSAYKELARKYLDGMRKNGTRPRTFYVHRAGIIKHYIAAGLAKIKAEGIEADALQVETWTEYIRAQMRDLPKGGKPESGIDPNIVLTRLDVKKLLEHATPRLSCMIEFLYRSGARVSEMCGITLKKLDEVSGGYNIKVIGKGRKERTLKLRSGIIKKSLEVFNGKKYLFETKRGNPYRREYISREIARLASRILNKKKVRAHALRHAFATHLIEATKNIKGVSKALGHSSVNLTLDTYTSLSLSWTELDTLAV